MFSIYEIFIAFFQQLSCFYCIAKAQLDAIFPPERHFWWPWLH